MKNYILRLIYKSDLIFPRQLSQIMRVIFWLKMFLVVTILLIGYFLFVSFLKEDNKESSSVTANLIGYIGLITSIFFAYQAYYFTKRFSPIVLNPQLPFLSVPLLKYGKLKIAKISMDNMVKQVSGKFASVYLLYTCKRGNTKNVIFKQVVRFSNKFVPYFKPVEINLSGKESHKIIDVDSSVITLYFDTLIKVNHFFILYEDFSRQTYLVMYVLFLDDKEDNLFYQPFSKYQLYDLDHINVVYQKIDIKNNLFWKKHAFQNIGDFQRKLIDEYNKIEVYLEKM